MHRGEACARACIGPSWRCGMSRSEKADAEKARYWARTISEVARSGMSIRAFCRQRRLRESQFYWWQHKLRASRQAGSTPKVGTHGRPASFALVSGEAGETDTQREQSRRLTSPSAQNRKPPGRTGWRTRSDQKPPKQLSGFREQQACTRATIYARVSTSNNDKTPRCRRAN
jgi:hypothetical protein